LLNILSWNVNGLRAIQKKGFIDFIDTYMPDVLGLQETKLQEPQIPEELKAPLGYHSVWNFAERKGYSGTVLYLKKEPDYIKTEFPADVLNGEGRIVEVGYQGLTIFNIYFPNGQKDEERLQYKLDFYDECLIYFDRLRAEGKKLVIMGDYNTAHKSIDLTHPKSNEKYSGFLPIERAWLDKFVAAGYVDTFRHFNQEPDQYTWWSYRMKAREKNVGWRIDYLFVGDDLIPNLEESYILSDIMGSDHCPIGLKISESAIIL
jgi:exodeoxyribonuclease III